MQGEDPALNSSPPRQRWRHGTGNLQRHCHRRTPIAIGTIFDRRGRGASGWQQDTASIGVEAVGALSTLVRSRMRSASQHSRVATTATQWRQRLYRHTDCRRPFGGFCNLQQCSTRGLTAAEAAPSSRYRWQWRHQPRTTLGESLVCPVEQRSALTATTARRVCVHRHAFRYRQRPTASILTGARHPVTGNSPSDEDVLFNFTFTARDGDGDATTAASLSVIDDSPVIDTSLITTGTVEEEQSQVPVQATKTMTGW